MFDYNLTRITSTFNEDLHAFLIMSHQMRSVSDKNCRKHQNTHLMFSKNFSDHCVVYEMR